MLVDGVRRWARKLAVERELCSCATRRTPCTDRCCVKKLAVQVIQPFLEESSCPMLQLCVCVCLSVCLCVCVCVLSLTTYASKQHWPRRLHELAKRLPEWLFCPRGDRMSVRPTKTQPIAGPSGQDPDRLWSSRSTGPKRPKR